MHRLVTEMLRDHGSRPASALAFSEYHITRNDDGEIDISFRLTVALSMLALDLSSANPREAARFTAFVNGRADCVSEENKESVAKILNSICAGIVAKADAALKELSDEFSHLEDPLVDAIMSLWRSERHFAASLLL